MGNSNSKKEQLKSFRELNQSIIDSIADPIMVIDTDYQVISMNHAAQNFAIGELSDTKPLRCYQLSHHLPAPCNGKGQRCPLERVRKLGQPVSVIHEHCQADGTRRIIEVHAAPLYGQGDQFIGIVESMRDVTERHQAELKLRKSTQQLRALTSQLAEVSENERKHLSQELHDQVGQNLTALGINLNIIRAEILNTASAPLLSRLDDSISLLEQTTQRIRDVMADLRPPLLDDYGLVAALKWCGQRFSKRTGIVMQIDGEEPSPRLAPRLENVLFRIAQEALTNVAKHAQAHTVSISLQEDNNHVKLIVADDGVGFEFASVTFGASNQNWGIITMMERAEAEGGRCQIESRSGSGTRVIAEINR